MKYKERYKEVFSQIHPSTEFNPEKLYARKPTKSITKKLISMAAAVAVFSSLCFTAYAVNLFGLRDLLLPQEHEVTLSEEASKPQQSPDIVDVISLSGYSDTAESRANAEWQTFLSSYDQDGEILAQIGNHPTGFETVYGFYQVYTQEMANKLEEIVAKYGLKLHTTMLDDLYTDEALCDQVGSDFLGENHANSTYMYEDGSFKFDGELTLAEYGLLNYQFQRNVRGSFSEIILNIHDVTDYEEWNYLTESGVHSLLALAPHKALIIVDLPDSFVTINVLTGTDSSFGKDELECLADSFDFSILSPARPADPTLPRPTLDEVRGKLTAEEFLQVTGVEEQDAQAFYSELLRHVENGDRLAVADKMHYPLSLTHWQNSESAPLFVDTTIASKEEFLLYYDDIFTESLWWSIMTTRYDLERAALIADHGMVGAADGAIWFAKTNGEFKVFSIQK